MAAKKEAPAEKPARVPMDRTEQVNAVIALMEKGTSERAACEQVGINRLTFRSAALKVGAVDHYARACEAIAQDQVEKLEAAIDEARGGLLDVQVARLEIDARKWLASKLLPKRYGDKLELDGGLTVKHDESALLNQANALLAKMGGA